MSINVLGQTIIILSSPADIKELFVNRASNYSARIRLTMIQLYVPCALRARLNR